MAKKGDFNLEVSIEADNTDLIIAASEEATKKALTMIGMQAANYARLELEADPRRIDTGLLRNSITFAVYGEGANTKDYKADRADAETGEIKSGSYEGTAPDEKGKVFIGTNVEYAPYVEFGTGIYADGGRKTPWVFKDSKGEWHKTSGMQPSHFLKKAIEENKSTYNQIIRDNLKG